MRPNPNIRAFQPHTQGAPGGASRDLTAQSGLHSAPRITILLPLLCVALLASCRTDQGPALRPRSVIEGVGGSARGSADGSAGASTDASTDSSTDHGFRAAILRRDRATPAHLLLSALAGPAGAVDAEMRAAPVARFRRPLDARARIAPSAELRRELARIAEALEQDDVAVARGLCEAAARAHPDSVEPLELALLVAMRTDDARTVTDLIDRIGRIDGASPFVAALGGMRAAGVGDAASTLAWLSWFVGPDALPRKGALAPLFTAPGELEEQAAFAALRLGHAQAALDALDAAIEAHAVAIDEHAEAIAARGGRTERATTDDPAAEQLGSNDLTARGDGAARARALTLLRADALALLGRLDDAADALAPLARELDAGRTADPAPILAAFRLDAMRAGAAGRVVSDAAPSIGAQGDAGGSAADPDAIDAAVAAALALPGDEVRLWRAVGLAQRADRDARTRAMLAVDAARERLGAVRHALLMAAFDPDRRTQMLDDAWLDLRDLGAPIDRAALRLTLRHLARSKRERLLPVATVVAQWRPNELDAVAVALLASGVEVDALLGGLADMDANPAAAALRSRIESRFGFAARGHATASEGRAAFPTSKVLRVAVALAAVDLADATILSEVDRAARGDDGSTDRTFALAWFALQEMPTARARAEDALRFDARDAAASLCASLASLEDPDARADAARRVRALAGRDDWIGAEAWSMQSEVRAADPGSSAAAAGWPAAASATAALRAFAARCEAQRIPLAAESLALAEEIDPAQGAVRGLQRLSIAPQAPSHFAEWTRMVIAEAPALPERRLLAVVRAATAARIPDSPLAARFDAIAAAPREVRAAVEREALAARPATVVAQAIECEMLVERGEFDAALARADGILARAEGRLASPAAPGDPPLPTVAGRRVLASLARIAEREPARLDELARRVEPLVLRLARLSPADLLAAGTVALAADPGPGATQRLMELLGDRVRPMLDAECDACIEVLGALAARAGDPFAAALLAERVCMQRRIAPEVRARIATAAVALRVGAGADAEETADLVDRLLAAGAVPWSETVLRPAADGAAPVASRGGALARASELFALLGADDEARALLEAALAASPDDADIMNRVAYADIEAGAIIERTAVLAARAGRARPDDPAVLDTIGWLRYQQGRFRDDGDGAGAISILRQALRVRPNSPSITTLDHLGDALWRAGDQEGAVRSWQQVGVVARRRYPPELFGERMSAFQRRTYGFELVPVVRFLRREYAAVVERTQRKLEQVAEGKPPDVAACGASR